MSKPISMGRALAIAGGVFVALTLFTDETLRLLAVTLYLALVLTLVHLPVRRARRAERRRLAFDADWQHAALMQGNIGLGVFGDTAGWRTDA